MVEQLVPAVKKLVAVCSKKIVAVKHGEGGRKITRSGQKLVAVVKKLVARSLKLFEAIKKLIASVEE